MGHPDHNGADNHRYAERDGQVEPRDEEIIGGVAGSRLIQGDFVRMLRRASGGIIVIHFLAQTAKFLEFAADFQISARETGVIKLDSNKQRKLYDE